MGHDAELIPASHRTRCRREVRDVDSVTAARGRNPRDPLRASRIVRAVGRDQSVAAWSEETHRDVDATLIDDDVQKVSSAELDRETVLLAAAKLALDLGAWPQRFWRSD